VVDMNRYKGISDDFRDATSKLANTWRSENDGWQDIKAKEFSEHVLKPISNECNRINNLIDRMDVVLSRLEECRLIDEK